MGNSYKTKGKWMQRYLYIIMQNLYDEGKKLKKKDKLWRGWKRNA